MPPIEVTVFRFWPLIFHPIVAGMLLWALRDDNPYSYYELLRWSVSAFFLHLAINLHGWFSQKLLFVLIAVAALYNPIIRPRLDKQTWSVINVITLVPLALTVRPAWRELE